MSELRVTDNQKLIEGLARAIAGRWLMDNTSEWDRLNNPVVHGWFRVYEESIAYLTEEES